MKVRLLAEDFAYLLVMIWYIRCCHGAGHFLPLFYLNSYFVQLEESDSPPEQVTIPSAKKNGVKDGLCGEFKHEVCVAIYSFRQPSIVFFKLYYPHHAGHCLNMNERVKLIEY